MTNPRRGDDAMPVGKTKHEWPKDMYPSGKSFLGFLNGKCVAISVQFAGGKGIRENAQTVREFAKNGYDIQTMDHDEACKIFHEAMMERHANKPTRRTNEAMNERK